MDKIVFVLGLIEILICIVCFFFKKKKHFLICVLTYNSILFIQYILQNYFLESLIIVIDIIRTIIFFVYAKKDLKPNFYVFLVVEIILIVSSIIMWQNWFSVFLLVASMLGAFAQWQKNMLFLRLSYIFSSILLILNYIFTGLYSTIIAEAITFVSAIVSVVSYHIIPYFKNKSKSNNDKNNEQIHTKQNDTLTQISKQ